jgi:N-carbamoylputrescine amidase
MGSASELFVGSIQTWATQNVVFVIAANRAGCETIDGITTKCYGLSCVASPRGEVIARAPLHLPDTVAIADIDLDEVHRARLNLTMYRDRRPELYGRRAAP